MSFHFLIENVDGLSQAGVTVLDGRVQEGKILLGQSVMLVQGDMQVPLRVDGVVLGGASGKKDRSIVSLVFQRQPGLDTVQAGDRLVA